MSRTLSSDRNLNNIAAVFPVSPAQKRLWILDQLNPGDTSYNLLMTVKISGPLDQRIFTQAVNLVVHKHESLRANIINQDQILQQQISRHKKVDINFQDFSSEDYNSSLQKIRKCFLDEANSPIDLENDALFRFTLIKQSETSHVFIVNIHHIVTDGWSMSNFVKELGQSYQVIQEKDTSQLNASGISLSKIINQRVDYLDSDKYQKGLNYWVEKLKDSEPEVKFNQAKPTQQNKLENTSGERFYFKIDSSLLAKLKQLALQQGVTLNMLMLAQYFVLLHRYTQQNDISIGSPVAARNTQDEFDSIAFFVNSIVFREQVQSDKRFTEFLKAVKQTSIDGLKYQDIPFINLVEAINPERSSTANPLYNVSFAFQNMQKPETKYADLEFELVNLNHFDDEEYAWLENDTGHALFDLTLEIIQTHKESLVATFEFNKKSFDQTMIRRMASHFINILESLCDDPEQKIADINLLSDKEKHQQCVEWQSQPVSLTATAVHHVFEHQVNKTPEAVAIRWNNQSINYQTLNKKSNQLAHYLIEKGIKRGDHVGICLGRSFDMIIAVLAAIKTGACYLPMDITYPEQRLKYMLEEVNAPILLTESVMQSLFLSDDVTFDTSKVFLVDQQWSSLSNYSIENPDAETHQDDPFYTIFTSGSTGRPKGASVSHLCEINMLDWYTKTTYPMSVDEKVLIMSAFGFDLTQKSIFAPLTSGATLVLPEFNEYEPRKLTQLIQKEQVTWTTCTPSALNPLVEDPDYWHELESMRYVFFGGEPLKIDKMKPWQQQSQCQLVNTFGPTECTDIAAYHHLEPLDNYAHRNVPIGKPNANVELYVLDNNQNLLPQGMTGEICIGGASVGLGYINRPDLTAEKFLNNPFNNDPKAILYRTGDLGRYQDDSGNIEHAGRIDFQLKLRGLRIELGEIEFSLQQQGTIKEALAMVVEGQVIAYLTMNENSALDEAQLKAHLLKFLPQYMVPAHFIVLERFPLTPHGKIDRQSLPQFVAKVSNEYVAPTTELETALANIWEQVLDVKRVGVQDNFFELGGHSLLATQLVSKIVSELEQQIALKDIFDHPSVAELTSFINKRMGDNTNASVASAITRTEVIANEYPLSFSQKRLWFIQKLQPENNAYLMPAVIKLSGNLDVNALQQSFLSIAQRHDILNAKFIEKNEQVIQTVQTISEWDLPVHDLSSLNSEEIEKSITELSDTFFNTPFDLLTDDLLKTQLIKENDEQYHLLVVMHHIVSDGWSVNLMMKELSQYYQAFVNGEQPKYLPLSIQYTDYAIWQNNAQQQEQLEAGLNFWTKKLDDATTLELTTDYPRPVKQTFNGDSVGLYIEPDLTHKLQTIEQQEGVTLFMILLSGLNILLKHYSGQNDICIGSPVANRNRTELEDLIGFFVNTIVLRQEIESGETIQSLLQSVKQNILEAFAHQDTPFEKIVDVLDIDHSLSHTPLFQVMFVLQNQNTESIQLPGLETKFQAHDNHTAKFDLTFNVEELRDGLDINLEYNRDLFKQETAVRLLNHFQTILKAMVNDLAQPVEKVSLLSLMEKKQILFDFNQKQFLSDTDPCLHQMIEIQAQEVPDQQAVVYNNESITYQKLNQLSNQLAHCLVDKGVKKGDFIGVFIDRSIDMIIALVAALKAGSAYVPMDPSYPDERIDYMLDDSRASVILTQEKLKSRLGQTERRVFCMDTQWNLVTNYSSNDLNLDIASDDLAYMIYTSGSTGQPKGVLCHHKGLVNLINDYQHKKPIEQGEQCSAWSTFSFDASVYEIFTALTAGGVLHIMEESIRSDAHKVIEFMNEHKINHSFFPAVYLQEYKQWLSDNPGQSSMKRIMTGVESIEESLLVDIQKSVDGLQIINSYGPTEGTIICLAYLINNEQPSGQHNAPIGTPVENVQIYILDQYQNPVPIGVKGEIYVGGVGVTNGYWNKDQLTSEKFIPNVFAPHKSKSLYRTGDIARYLPDGNIQFVGRSDNQIKLRGYRIELGEIETRLKALPIVNETVVTVYEEVDSKNKRLIAYVTLDKSNVFSEVSIDNQFFREQLRGALPDYMVPASFIILDEFPLLPNGKLDKRSLPLPSMNREDNYKAPETDEEKQISNIWSEILKIDKVGINDNFFDLGGHSLIATQIVSRINKHFNCDMQVMQLFEMPYVAQLAQSVSRQSNSVSKSQSTLSLTPRPQEAELELSFSQERIWFLDKYEPDNTAYNVPMALTIRGELDIIALEKTFRTIIQRHEILRTNFIEDDSGQLLQTIHPRANWKLSIKDLQNLKKWEQHEQSKQLIDDMVNTPFDLSNDLLFRASIVLLKKQKTLLLINVHHIISDGWSMGILLNEVDRIYREFIQSKKSGNTENIEIPELPVQYADYAYWQRKMHTQGKMNTQFDYWKKQLKDVATLELPTDKKRPAIQTFNGDHHIFQLSSVQTARINELCQRHHISPFMFFMGVLNVMLYRYTNQNDICVGTPVAGRNHQETESMIGLFVNTLAIRNTFTEQVSFNELLEQIKQTTLEAYANQDAPFDRIVEDLELPRNLSTTPVFQVMLSMQNSPIQALEFSGLSITPEKIENPTSKFDMLLDITERNDNFELSLEYNTDLFFETSIVQMSRHITNLIDIFLEDDNLTNKVISTIDFLDDSDKKEILFDVNNTESNLDGQGQFTFYELFEKQVNKTPDNIAVVFDKKKLTYRELETLSNQLAHLLIEEGVKSNSFVGISIERSINMIIGLIAIMKAGAAYVPLDSEYPLERINYMLDDSKATHLLTSSSIRSMFTNTNVNIIDLEKSYVRLSDFSEKQPELKIYEDLPVENMLAYVIYTSGSTGLPKGVCIEHRNLTNFLMSMKSKPGIKESDKLLAVTSISFDIHTLEVYLPLLSGACVIVASEELTRDPVGLMDTISLNSVNIMQATPATWKMLLANNWQPEEPIKVLCGGEALSETLRKSLCEQHNIDLWNMYGPTETTVWSSVNNIKSIEQKISIGKPIHNTSLYVLDENQMPVPRGVVGELYIGGDGVARGYLNGKIDRSDLTNERFINKKLADKSERIYRTGDECRLLPNGEFEILGRKDEQVKIQGHRIELGEIETLLNNCEMIKESVVLVKSSSNEVNQLVAYTVVASSFSSQSEDSLIELVKQGLLKKLPLYMVPSFFKFLEELPLTPNGKINKIELLKLDISVNNNDSFIEPKTEIEQKLAEVWSNVLGVNKIGITDDFFSLGGNSLQASQIIAQIRTQYQVEIPVKELFTEPTIAALSLLIEKGIDAGPVADGSMIRKRQRVDASDEKFDDFDDALDIDSDFLNDDIDDKEADEEFEI